MVAALTLAAVASPSSTRAAQDSDLSTRETRSLMHAYAKCVVGREPRRASEALVRNINNRSILREYPQLIIGNCLVKQTKQSATMSFSGDLYRYALADALVGRELAALPPPDFSAVPRLAQRAAGEPPKPIGPNGRKLSAKKYQAALDDHKEDAAIAYIARYGECVVRSASAEARALLLTVPDSAEESARFGALRPALGTCLPENETLRFGRTTLRGTIAVNYYRLAHAARLTANRAAG
jgi:hypothetical protein